MKNIKLAIDKRSTVSVVDQIKDYIYVGIMKLKIQNGDILPSTEELAEEINVPSTAIRSAYKKLIDMALIIKINNHYEVTYNANPNVFHNKLIHINDTLKASGETPEVVLLKKVKVKATDEIAKLTGFQINQDLVNFSRLYKSNNQPLFIASMYFPLDIFPDLDQADMTNKMFYSFFRKEYEIIMSKSMRNLNIISSNEEISSLLHISKDMPIFYEITHAYDQYDRLIEYGELWCAPRHRIPSILEENDIRKYFK
jgi:GntR family transcriptional regulator